MTRVEFREMKREFLDEIYKERRFARLCVDRLESGPSCDWTEGKTRYVKQTESEIRALCLKERVIENWPFFSGF